MRIEVTAEVRRRVPAASVHALRRRLTRAARRVGADPGAVSVRIVGDDEMSALHLAHMKLAGPTDVLSFPAADVPGGDAALGDIVIDWDAAHRQAGARGVLNEAVDLGVHGLAHLLGHDHEAGRTAARAMLRTERRACAAAGLPNPQRPYGGQR